VIADVIEYGGTIYWSLLLFFCIITTLFAERRQSVLIPSLWGIATLVYAFGFTSYAPSTFEVTLGVVAYLLLGAVFTIFKWSNLVHNIGHFVKTVSPYQTSSYELRHLVHEAFKPMDANDVMKLPPDPYEFRTRLTCWFLFWPSFTIFRCFAHGARWLGRKTWGFFFQVSKRLYEHQD
tara:strand:+ start:8173 stop:8706 length:534 start_codon:yes stop_codon:yes gene_type:complete